MMASEKNDWPPERSNEYFRSELFGALMLEIVKELTTRYAYIDFTDAVATAFSWFVRKGDDEPDFLQSGKFPTISAFRAYVRQSLWNSARAAERNRRARRQLNSLEKNVELVSPEISPVWLAAFHECRDRLPEPLRSVFDHMQDEDDPPCGMSRDAWAGSVLGLEPHEVDRAYMEACRQIRQCMGR
jgi:hypothetical protein